MKISTTLLSILFISATIISCSPEVKIQNHLTKNGGRWNIDEFKTTVTVSITPDDSLVYQAFNVGEALFYESGTGIWIQYDTTLLENIATYFEWENTATTILLNMEDETDEIEFKITEVSKDEQFWVREEEVDVSGVITKTAIEIHLVREEEIANI